MKIEALFLLSHDNGTYVDVGETATVGKEQGDKLIALGYAKEIIDRAPTKKEAD